MGKENSKSDHIVVENKKYEIISKLRKESQLNQKKNDIIEVDKLLFKEDDMIVDHKLTLKFIPTLTPGGIRACTDWNWLLSSPPSGSSSPGAMLLLGREIE